MISIDRFDMGAPTTKSGFRAHVQMMDEEVSRKWDRKREANRRDESQESINLCIEYAEAASSAREYWLNKYGHLYDGLPNE